MHCRDDFLNLWHDWFLPAANLLSLFTKLSMKELWLINDLLKEQFWSKSKTITTSTGNVQAAQDCWHLPAAAKYSKGSCPECPWGGDVQMGIWRLAAVVEHSHARSLLPALGTGNLCSSGLPNHSHYLKRNSSSLWPQLLVCPEQCQIYSGSFLSSFHSWALKTFPLLLHLQQVSKCATLRAKGFPLPGSLLAFFLCWRFWV